MDKLRTALFKETAEKGPSPPDKELWSPSMGSDYREFWNAMAKDRQGAYLAVAGEPFGEPATEESLSRHGADTARIIGDVLEIGPEDGVLEVGVGVGRLAEHLAPRCGSFTGMDVSDNMIKVARERLSGMANVELRAHGQSDLSPFPDGSFDKVYFQVVLIHLDREDAYHYMRETLRVLRPGGRAWFQFYNLLHDGGFKEFEFAVNYMVEKGGKTRGRVHCYTASEVRRLVEKAGFRIDEQRSRLAEAKQDFGYRIPDLDWEFYLIAVGEKPANG